MSSERNEARWGKLMTEVADQAQIQMGTTVPEHTQVFMRYVVKTAILTFVRAYLYAGWSEQSLKDWLIVPSESE